MLILPHDSIIEICSFIDTLNILKLSYTCKKLYESILQCRIIMIDKIFTVRKNIHNLVFITKLPYKLYNLDISFKIFRVSINEQISIIESCGNINIYILS